MLPLPLLFPVRLLLSVGDASALVCLPFYEVRRCQAGKLRTLQGRQGHAGDRGEGSGRLGLWVGSGWTTVYMCTLNLQPAPLLGIFWALHTPLRGNCGRCSLGLIREELWLREVWGRSWVGAGLGGGRPPVGGGFAGHLDGWASVPDSPGLRGGWPRLAQDPLLGLKLGSLWIWGAALGPWSRPRP